MDIEQLLQQMGMSGGYQQSNPQGPTIGPQGPAPDPFGGMGQVDTPTIKPGNSDILGNLIVGQKLRSLDELRAQRLKQEQPATKMGKANEYLKAILSGFTHTAYKDPAKRAEELSQKDYQLETQRATSEAKDIKNLIDQQRYQGMLAQATAKIEETRQERLRKTQADQNKDAVARALLDLKQADSKGETAKSAAQIKLNEATARMRQGYADNPVMYKEAGPYAIAQKAVELSGVDPNSPEGKKLFDQYFTSIESEKLFGDKSYNRTTTSSGPHPIAAVGPDGRIQVALPNITRQSTTQGGRPASPINGILQGLAGMGQQPAKNVMGQPITPQSQGQATAVAPIQKPNATLPPPDLTPTANAKPANKLVAQPASVTNVNGIPVIHLSAYKDAQNPQFQIKLIDTMDNLVSTLSDAIASGEADKVMGPKGGRLRHLASGVINSGPLTYRPFLQQVISDTDIATLAKTYADSGKQINEQELKIAKGYWPHIGALSTDKPEVALQKALAINIILRAGAWKTQIASQLNLTPEEVNKIKTDGVALRTSQELVNKIKEGKLTSEEMTRAISPDLLFADQYNRFFGQRPSPFTPKKVKTPSDITLEDIDKEVARRRKK